jgi:5,10-methylenetetrahydrofolate reductase
MSLSAKIASGGFVITSEVGPPKGVEVEELLKEAELITKRVDAINVTDLQSSVMRVGSLAVSRLLVEKGLEPVFQITCRDRNRLALQSDVLSAYVLGIRNILVLTGDHQSLGDHPESKGVFDLDSVQLIAAIRKLESGVDMAGKKLKGSPKFCIGAVINPGAEPLEPQIVKMEKKVEAGAQFFQTQGVFDVNKFKIFRGKTRHIKVPVFAGIILLKSAKMAQFMNENVAGINVPVELIKRMEETKDKVAESVKIASELIKELKGHCEGIHLMPLGWSDKVPEVLDGAGL